jgi:hypothetical protein
MRAVSPHGPRSGHEGATARPERTAPPELAITPAWSPFDDSPRCIAQRRDIARAFGPALQRESPQYAEQHEKSTLETLGDVTAAVRELLDGQMSGTRGLFLSGGLATTPAEWGALVHGLLQERYDFGEFGVEDCTEVIENLKARYRRQELVGITQFFDIFNVEDAHAPWDLATFKQQLKAHYVYLEDNDDKALAQILEARGDEQKLQGSSKQGFRIGGENFDFDEKELKLHLNTELGDTVNWGHEITDCMDDAGKKGALYYAQGGQDLQELGGGGQSHASSQGGRTLIWQAAGANIEILAVGKHTTAVPPRLAKSASYTVIKAFAAPYTGFENKVVGFKV